MTRLANTFASVGISFKRFFVRYFSTAETSKVSVVCLCNVAAGHSDREVIAKEDVRKITGLLDTVSCTRCDFCWPSVILLNSHDSSQQWQRVVRALWSYTTSRKVKSVRVWPDCWEKHVVGTEEWLKSDKEKRFWIWTGCKTEVIQKYCNSGNQGRSQSVLSNQWKWPALGSVRSMLSQIWCRN